MDSLWSTTVCTIGLVLCSVCTVLSSPSTLYYIEDICAHHLDFDNLGLQSVRLQLTKFQFYHNNMDCQVRLRAPRSKRFEVKVLKRVIKPSTDCTADYLQVFDGSERTDNILPGMPERICDNTHLSPSYASTGSNVTVYFRSDPDGASEGFRLLFTAFRDDPNNDCYDNEFQCRSTQRCISDSLKCDTFEDCADASDECTLSIAAVIGISVGGVLVVVIVTGAIYCYCRQKRRRAKATEATNSTQYLSSSYGSSDPYTTPEDSVDGGVLYYTPQTSQSQPVMAVPHVITDGTNIMVSNSNHTQVLKKSLRRSLPAPDRDSWITPPPSSRSLKPSEDFFSAYNY